MKFFDVDGGASKITDAECVRVAQDHDGVLIGSGLSFACPVATARFPLAQEWGSRRIGTAGTGNGGSLVLVGLTPRTRGILREVKVRRLVERGIDATIAQHAVSVRYGLERGVAELAQMSTLAVFESGRFSGNSHADFDRWLGFECPPEFALSFPRKLSVAEIAWLACG